MTRPIAVDLFSGCGGVSEGLRQAGFRVACAVEIDPFAAKTYRLNHQRTVVLNADIREVDPLGVREVVGPEEEVGLLAACAPCQGFSRLRTRNRRTLAKDERNDLLLAVLPFVRALMPTFVMLENVPAARDASQMDVVRTMLVRHGYQFREAMLDVADYGVPQRRRRYILVASREGSPAFPEAVERQMTVRDAIGDLPLAGTSGDDLHDVSSKRTDRIAELIALIPPDGGSRTSLPSEWQLACHSKIDGFFDVYGRMAWDKPAPTITGSFVNPSKGRFLHPVEHRTVSLREAALLQSFPPTYRFPTDRGKYAIAEMIGNAVPPEFARRQAVALRRGAA